MRGFKNLATHRLRRYRRRQSGRSIRPEARLRTEPWICGIQYDKVSPTRSREVFRAGRRNAHVARVDVRSETADSRHVGNRRRVRRRHVGCSEVCTGCREAQPRQHGIRALQRKRSKEHRRLGDAKAAENAM